MKKIMIASALTLLASASFAHDYKLGDLVIEQPVARATPVNAPVSAGYMTITNNGNEDEILVGASVEFAGAVELHEMAMDGDVMKMRELDGGIAIPAGQSVTLMPGGLHLMFMEMKQQVTEGEAFAATLEFAKAGTIEVTLDVESLTTIRARMAEQGKDMGHSGHDHSGHNH